MISLSIQRLFFIPLLACACHSWSPVRLAPKMSSELPTHSRVVRKGSLPVPLYRGNVTADSIIGSRGDSGRFAIARDSVTRVEERHFSLTRTIQAIGGVGFGLALLLYVGLSNSEPGTLNR